MIYAAFGRFSCHKCMKFCLSLVGPREISRKKCRKALFYAAFKGVSRYKCRKFLGYVENFEKCEHSMCRKHAWLLALRALDVIYVEIFWQRHKCVVLTS